MDAAPPDSPTPDPNPFEPPRAPGGPPRRRRYRPMPILARILGGGTVVLAGLIAFVGACFPLGLGAFAMGAEGNLGGFFFAMAWLIGAAVAGLAMFGVFRLVFRSPGRELPPDERTRP